MRGRALTAVVLALACCGEAPNPTPEVTRPYLGVACPRPNRIVCDRVGFAVFIAPNPRRVRAAIDGHEFALRQPPDRGDDARTYWEGFLQPAGLREGALGRVAGGAASRR